MSLTVLGASGQVGRLIVGVARDRGVPVRAVWRTDPDRPPLAGVEDVVEPDLLSVSALRRVTDGADVVVSSIGQRRTRPRNPWSSLISPPDLCARLGRALLEATDAPLIVVSAAGVGESRPKLSIVLRWLFDHSKVGVGYRDLAEMEQLLRAARRPCVCVRPTTLTNGRSTRVREVDRFRLWSRVSRRAVATYVVDRALGNPPDELVGVMISGR